MTRNLTLTAILLAVLLPLIAGCSDLGKEPPNPVSLQQSPQILSLQPDSAFVGDTLTILGNNFGVADPSNRVSIGGAIVDSIFLWSPTKIRTNIPAAALSGNVVVTVGGVASNGFAFKVRGAVVEAVSFANDVLPIFVSKGCTGCHGGTNNLFVDTYAHLMSGGSVNGPVVTPFNGEGSKIIMKLRGTASFGARMPQGGPYLDNATIDKISTWITQGALNN